MTAREIASSWFCPSFRIGFSGHKISSIRSKHLVLYSNSFLGLLLAEGLVLFFAFEAHGMMIRSVNPNLQLEQSTSPDSSSGM